MPATLTLEGEILDERVCASRDNDCLRLASEDETAHEDDVLRAERILLVRTLRMHVLLTVGSSIDLAVHVEIARCEDPHVGWATHVRSQLDYVTRDELVD